VLKYPLLLKELVSLTDNESEEHYHLTGNFFLSSAGMNDSYVLLPALSEDAGSHSDK